MLRHFLPREGMRPWLFLAMLLGSCLPCFGQTNCPAYTSGTMIAARVSDWCLNAGLPSTLPDGETTANAWTPPTARSQCTTSACNTVSGGTVTFASLNAAIASAPAQSYVLIPAGSFNLAGAGGGGSACQTSNNCVEMYNHNYVSLRGSGAQSTILNISGDGSNFQFGVCCLGSGSGTLSATSYSPGTTSVTITGVSSATNLLVGNMAWFIQCDTGWSGNPCNTGSYSDPWPSGPTPLWVCGRDYTVCTQDNNPNGSHNFQQQNVLITGVTNNGGGSYTVSFTPGLYMPSWSSNNTATLNWQQESDESFGMGIENMTIRFVYNSSNTTGNKLDMSNTYASWVTGVRFVGYPVVADIEPALAAHVLITNNYIYANDYNNFSSNIGEPIVLGAGAGEGTSDTLVLNNIINGGLCHWGEGNRAGDVIAFEYCRDAQTPDFQIVSLDHGVNDDFTLHEANQMGKLQSDDTHGTHNLFTWFRNDLSGADPPYLSTNPATLQVDNYQRMGNVLGNALGSAPYSTSYQSTGGTSAAAPIYTIPGGDTLTNASLYRFGNWDYITNAVRWCGNSSNTGWSTTCSSTSEVPTSLTGNAAPFDQPVPSSQTLPCSFFLSTSSSPCSVKYSGGSGLSFNKVCTSWSSFPTCSGTQTAVYPAIGPEVTGGPYQGGHAYDIPSAIAWKNLPTDTSYQGSFTITGATWSASCSENGITYACETLTVSLSSIDNGSAEHIMGGFQLSGVNSACLPTSGVSYTGRSDGELLMTYSSTTVIQYAMPSNPGVSCTGSLLYPDIREFSSTIYQADSTTQASSPSCSPGTGSYVGSQTVTCTNPNSGTTVMCYNFTGSPATNGSGTGCTTGTQYSSALTISSSETLYIVAGTSTLSDSSVVSYTYTIASPVIGAAKSLFADLGVELLHAFGHL